MIEHIRKQNDMKSNKYTYLLACGLIAAGLTGCSDDNGLLTDDVLNGAPEELTLTLNIPDPQIVEIGTRVAETQITKVSVLCYEGLNQTGNLLQTNSAYSVSDNGTKVEVKVKLHSKTKSMHIVANQDVNSAPASAIVTDVNAGVMWGKANLSDVVAPGSSLTMLRQYAKVSVNSAPSGFTFMGFGVGNTADKGTVAPSNYSYEPATASVPSGAAFNKWSGIKGTAEEVKVFETPKNKNPRIIIRGKYNGIEGYYCIAFRTREGNGASEIVDKYTYTDIDIIRNHWYKLNISEVRGTGWPTYQDALNAEPDNRITAWVEDTTPEITDVIADRDGLLGVCDAVSVGYSENAKITIVTNVDGGKYELSSTSDWILASQSTVDKQETLKNGAIKYTITVKLSSNENSNLARDGILNVRSGNLYRTIAIHQLGRDYRRDPQRPVVLTGLPNRTVNDYFSFLDNELKGVKPEDDYKNVERNQGLHFPAVPAYTLTYKIKKLSGDGNPSITGGFNYTDDGSNYVITLSNTSAGIETGIFKFTNSQGAEVIYPLYKTGYIHELKNLSNEYGSYQREGATPITGWFYYGVVNCNGKYVLDRNLGASNNLPYITTYAGYTGENNPHTQAIGAYFKISNEKSTDKNNPSTILSDLKVSGFKIPTTDEVSSWGVTTTNQSETPGEQAIVATFKGKVESNREVKVFIPHAGYYEATSLKYETHANIWTSTLLSGNQGFDPALSPEFGYWYLYLNVYGSITNFSQMRFANGSGGVAPTAESVFKYMPIRLMWGR